ncbi:hypothetical protein BDW22DRAFT_990093 [Trametopsis cervina]|nr:hypothetical protein BDW22DRAFT_990093 [Trametopsis cervina]
MKVTNPLQRGKACLSCRQRKMRCDGVRPVCSQCSKAHRETDCQYQDKKQVSRTEMLRAKVKRLEERLRSLENEQSPESSSSTPATLSPEPSTSSHMSGIFLMQPGMSAAASSSASSESDQTSPLLGFSSHLGSDSEVWPSNTWAEHFSDLPVTLHGPVNDFPLSSPPASPPSSYSLAFDHADDHYAFSHQLLDIFLAHRRQCAFDVDVGRLRASMTGPPAHRPHPALLDSMYLLGSYFSNSPRHTEKEPYFLQNALVGISSALQHHDRLVQVVQASCLIAIYFFSRGRVLEGYYHSSTAARLAVSLGLHQIKPEQWYQLQLDVASSSTQSTFITFKPSLQLPAPRDSVEYAERVAVFWQVFIVDRAWSVASGLPAALPDDGSSPRGRIETSWPISIREPSFPADLDPLTGQDHGKLLPSLRAKAVLLFEKTYRFTSQLLQKDNAFMQLDLSLSQLIANLPPMPSLIFQDRFSANDIELLSVYTLVNASVIHLHRDFFDLDSTSYQRCILAAQSITKAVRDLTEADYEYLDPISSTCWRCAAFVYMQSLNIQQSQLMPNSALLDEIQKELNTLRLAMRALGRVFPVAV